MIFVEEYKGFKIYLDTRRGKFLAQKESVEKRVKKEKEKENEVERP